MIVVAFEGRDPGADRIAAGLGAVYSRAGLHRFPDGECRVRIEPETVSKRMLVVCSLYDPDPVIVPLLFLAQTLRDYGAERLLLVAPYLAYMRQDCSFNEGEGISARYFAGLISHYFDGLITVDPHLHRIKFLDEIYTIPSRVVHAAPLAADWIRDNVDKPLLIGPDSESKQWVVDLARRAGAPCIVLEKIRRGDRDVEINLTDVERWRRHTPVLFDDIISTGKTMMETVKHLKQAGLAAPVCIGVHGVFSGDAYQELLAAGVEKVVTANSIPHASNAIDLTPLLCEAAKTVFS